jgi:hypothetical protein
VVVSLPFLGYLGCATRRIETDLKADVIPARRLLRDVHGFEENYFARLWSVVDKAGFMATAKEVRNRVADRARGEAQRSVLEILRDERDGGTNGSARTVDRLNQWGAVLEESATELRDTTEAYRPAALQIRSLGILCRRLAQALSIPGTEERRNQIAALPQKPEVQMAMTDTVRNAIRELIPRFPQAEMRPPTLALAGGAPAPLTAVVTGGWPPYTYQWSGPEGTGPFAADSTILVKLPGTYSLRAADSRNQQVTVSAVVTVGVESTGTTLKDRYNQLIDAYGGLATPESRLSSKLISALGGMLPPGPPLVAGSQHAYHRISQFLKRVAPYSNDMTLKLKVNLLTEPVRVRFGEPARIVVQGESFDVPHWRLGRRIRLEFISTLSPGTEVPLLLDDAIGKQSQPLQIPVLQGKGGGPVVFQYEVVDPPIDDTTIPPLEKVQ